MNWEAWADELFDWFNSPEAQAGELIRAWDDLYVDQHNWTDEQYDAMLDELFKAMTEDFDE